MKTAATYIGPFSKLMQAMQHHFLFFRAATTVLESTTNSLKQKHEHEKHEDEGVALVHGQGSLAHDCNKGSPSIVHRQLYIMAA